jgi:hypothetical protein
MAYKGWAKKKASLLGLRISGEYDYIDHTKLLQILIAKWHHDWLIKILDCPLARDARG